jgi:Cys-tRNA(Pro) deacylase
LTDREPGTPALDALAGLGIPHEVVRTRRARSVAEAAGMRGIPVGALLKTLVIRRGDEDYLFVLVPGDRSIDWSKLRALLDVRRLSLPDAADALRVTGYERGTITPFGSTTAWPVVADAAVAGQDVVSLGGGAHGISVKLRSDALIGALAATVADVTKPEEAA